MWRTIKILGYFMEAKIYDTGSKFGIAEAPRISKLHIIKNGKELLGYDRGWDFNEMPEFTYRLILSVLNHLF